MLRMSKKGTAAENSISTYYVWQETQRGGMQSLLSRSLQLQGKTRCRTEHRSKFGVPRWWQKETGKQPGRRLIGEQEMTKQAGYFGDKLGADSSSFVFTHKYNEKLLETLRRWYMIQGMAREDHLEVASCFHLSAGDWMEGNGHWGI